MNFETVFIIAINILYVISYTSKMSHLRQSAVWRKGLMVLVVYMTLIQCPSGASLPECTDDDHCTIGRFCQDTVCNQCLSCEALKRQPPDVAMSCIKSVGDCGPCLKGLVNDLVEGGLGCVSAATEAPLVSTWALIGICVFATIVIASIVAYSIWRFFPRASLNADVRAWLRPGGGDQNEAPPPYSAPSAPYNSYPISTSIGGEDFSLINGDTLKPLPTREDEESQAAEPTNPPCYVRLANGLQPDANRVHYEDEAAHEPRREAPRVDEEEVRPAREAPVMDEEETRQSFWIAGTTSDIADANAVEEAAGGGGDAHSGPTPPNMANGQTINNFNISLAVNAASVQQQQLNVTRFHLPDSSEIN